MLDASDRKALVFFPSNASSGEKFPLIEYAHGAAGGNIDLIGYDRYVRVHGTTTNLSFPRQVRMDDIGLFGSSVW